MVGTSAYFALLLMLRASGTRTLSKMNAFDFVVTVAFGSTLATVMLSEDVALAEGGLALALPGQMSNQVVRHGGQHSEPHRISRRCFI